eukprot:gnl/TRDRNA2_/TRDRNA2_160676_c0_seq1.p1 gnl/TRDRNA2_/TRDRNA2_160676_c0~~gnl/TRDRNA2_/TRDRNA2_160676_c0_seq1.p1  ORF type:complete len:160 (-),score=28.07 gnl/TRDRNA2_/TRDRNA2_160676_c0_seq1:332-811(-)
MMNTRFASPFVVLLAIAASFNREATAEKIETCGKAQELRNAESKECGYFRIPLAHQMCDKPRCIEINDAMVELCKDDPNIREEHQGIVAHQVGEGECIQAECKEAGSHDCNDDGTKKGQAAAETKNTPAEPAVVTTSGNTRMILSGFATALLFAAFALQ